MDISGKKGDIWSLGVSIYLMLFGRLPFTGKTVHALYRSIVEDDLVIPPPPPALPPSPSNSASGSGSGSSALPHNPNGITVETHPELVDLLQRMLDKNPHTRIGLKEIKQHPWVTQHGVDPMEEQCLIDDTQQCQQHHQQMISVSNVASPSSATSASSAASNAAMSPLHARSQSLLDARARRMARAKEAASGACSGAHGRSQSSSSALDEGLVQEAAEEEEEVLTDTDTEVEEDEQHAHEPIVVVEDGDSVFDLGGTDGRSMPRSRSQRVSLSSYPRLSITHEDVADAVTLVSRVCLVVKLKSKMRKLRGQLAVRTAAADGESNARRRSCSMGDVYDQSNTGRGAGRGTGGGGGGSTLIAGARTDVRGPPAQFKAASIPPGPLSPSLSMDTHISVPVDHNSVGSGAAGGAVSSVHAKRRAAGAAIGDLLAEARAAISAGKDGGAAAHDWEQRANAVAAAASEHEESDPTALAVRLNLTSPKGTPLSPPHRPVHGRIAQFPHRRGTPRASGPVVASHLPFAQHSTDGGSGSVVSDGPRSSASDVSLCSSAASSSSSLAASSSAAQQQSPPADSLQGSTDSLTGQFGAMSGSSGGGDDGLDDAAGARDEHTVRHQSAPLRPPPPLFVPYDTYLAMQPHSLSCSNMDDQAQQRSVRAHRALIAATANEKQKQLQQQQEEQRQQQQQQQEQEQDPAASAVDAHSSFGSEGDTSTLFVSASAAAAPSFSASAVSSPHTPSTVGSAPPPAFLRSTSSHLYATLDDSDSDNDVGAEELEGAVEAVEPMDDLNDI
jgi:hypothetical protein